jgi:hypothetical protein
MIQNSHFHHASENGLTVCPENPKNITRITFPADGTFWLKVNWDVSIALKHAFIQVGSNTPMICPR